MKRFLIEILGENFLLDLDGDHGKFGFKTMRIVKAKTSSEAEQIALIKIHHELNQSPHVVKNTPDAPRVYTKLVDELKFYHLVSRNKSRGLEFISEENS